MPTVPWIVNHYDLPDSTDELKVVFYKFLYFYFQMLVKINQQINHLDTDEL